MDTLLSATKLYQRPADLRYSTFQRPQRVEGTAFGFIR
jgi:hypothetical protein